MGAKESKVSAIESPTNESEKLQETDLTNVYSKRTFEDLYKVKIPSDLTEVEVDTMKLTAQFTARNVKAFLTGLFNREQNNPLFSFVRPNSNHFITFTNFVDAYQRIITSPKKTKEKISQELDDPNIVLTRCIKRFELDKTHNAELKFSEEAAEKERLEILSIDWYDFTIVETIEFYEEEDAELPLPTSLKDVILLSKTRKSKKIGVNEAIIFPTPYNEKPLIENFKSLDKKLNGSSECEAIQKVPLSFEDLNEIKVIKNFTRQPLAATTSIPHIRSPLTGEVLAIGDVAEHMKINLVAQKRSTDAKEYTTISDDEIALNVLKLAKHRTNFLSGSRKKVITEEPLLILQNLKNSNMSDEKKKIRPNKVPKKVKGLLNKLQSHSLIPSGSKLFLSLHKNNYKNSDNKKKKVIQVDCANLRRFNSLTTLSLKLLLNTFDITVAELKDRLVELVSLKATEQLLFTDKNQQMEDSVSLAPHCSQTRDIINLSINKKTF